MKFEDTTVNVDKKIDNIIDKRLEDMTVNIDRKIGDIVNFREKLIVNFDMKFEDTIVNADREIDNIVDNVKHELNAKLGIEIANVMQRPPVAKASRPPFIADRCFRTQFRPSMEIPLSSNIFVTRALSSKVIPLTGTVSPAEAPPDSSTTKILPFGTSDANSNARRPALTLPSVGMGCPTSKHSIPSIRRPV